MTALSFPSNPTNGQLYTGPNGTVYAWDGEKWTVNSTVYTGTALTEITQDRVQSMFSHGENVGISFSYNDSTDKLIATVADSGPADRLVNGANEVVLGTDGALRYPRNALQQATDTVECLGNTSTVVYTASGQYQHTIKLLIQVEGFEAPETTNWDTQACEMMVARSWRANNIASTVYGIVHTSTAPLATFSAQWNALTNRIEVLCATPSANNVYVRIFATEIYTAD